VGNSTIGAAITINANQNNENQVFQTGAAVTFSKCSYRHIYSYRSNYWHVRIRHSFTFGQQFQIFANLSAEAQALAASPNAAASGASTFDSSGHWGGISNVHLADGTLLNGYTLNSQSGFNWLKRIWGSHCTRP
jgi:hypothetical protein